ncbi:MAG: HEPN domain-containing protein [Bacteroidetes bacterium]|nr:HEPN domain-containing protein [Bacteroidota bacterium]
MTKEDHIRYWIDSSAYDWKSTDVLLKGKQYMFALFTCHLMLEKLLKAHWVKDNEQNFPPRVHNLVSIHNQTKLNMPDEYLENMAVMNAWNIEGRYSDYTSNFYKQCTKIYSQDSIKKANEIRLWLLSRLQ